MSNITVKRITRTVKVNVVTKNVTVKRPVRNVQVNQVGRRGLTGPQGPRGFKGDQGDPGQGVPTGGNTGQVLAKATNSNYDTEWVDQSGGGGAIDSVNGQTGTVVLDQDDIGDGTTYKQYSATEKTKLGFIAVTQSVDLDTMESDIAGKVTANGTITGATKTKITYDSKGLVTAGTDATTADIADSTNKRYVTDAQQTVIANTSGVNTGDQTSVTGNAGTATKLATPRNINGVAFDGSADITIADATKQPLDSDLTTIAGLTPTTDNFMVATAGAWASRTPSQARTQMGLGTIATLAAPSGTVVGTTDSQTLSAKRIVKRITSITSSATPTVNTDNCDKVDITALATAITSMTTNLSGTPNNGDMLMFEIKDDGTGRAITWGASFAAGGVALPTTTVASKILTVGFVYSTANALNKWRCIASAQEI